MRSLKANAIDLAGLRRMRRLLLDGRGGIECPVHGMVLRNSSWEALLTADGLPIRWTTVLVGLREHQRTKVLVGEVAAFADRVLQETEDPPDALWELAAIDPRSGNDLDSLDRTRELLRRLAASGECDQHRELRRWRLADLKATIHYFESALRDAEDPTSDIYVALQCFWDCWADLGRPASLFEGNRVVLPAATVEGIVASYRGWIDAERIELHHKGVSIG
jgi:hypothetical protein